ncbi:MAG TPA: hypothetical protein VMU88_10690 [bacterium]|nr:hypothetical protein [bacterium]
MKKALLGAIFTLLFSQNPTYASDARVDATGGLSLVVTDEVDDVNPFNLGDPAGLALLAPQTRFDAGGEWVKEYFPPSGDQFHVYGAMNDLTSDNVKYHGLIAFLNNNWAIQADGDTLHTEGEQNPSNNVDTNDRYRGTFKTAYDFGIFTLGGQIQPSQSNVKFKDHFLTTVTSDEILSATGTMNSLSGTGAILINLLGTDNTKQDHLRVGGIVSTQLTPSQEVDSLPVSNTLSTNTFTLTQTTTDQNVLTWGPEIYFDSPGFQAALVGRLANFDVSFEQDSTNSGAIANISKFKAESGTISAGIAVFKITSPIASGLNLKTGGAFTLEIDNSNSYQTSGAANGGASITGWNGQFGVGFENPQDYTLGIQVSAAGINGNEGNSASVTTTNNYFDYKISVGGERWISKHWAVRLGFTYEDANNKGTAEQPGFFFPIDPGLEVQTNTLSGGLGYADARLKLDLNLFIGQPQVANDPSGYGNQYGAQGAASLLF